MIFMKNGVARPISRNTHFTILLISVVLVASLPIPLEIKAPATALASTVTAAILLFWKRKVNKQ